MFQTIRYPKRQQIKKMEVPSPLKKLFDVFSNAFLLFVLFDDLLEPVFPSLALVARPSRLLPKNKITVISKTKTFSCYLMQECVRS